MNSKSKSAVAIGGTTKTKARQPSIRDIASIAGVAPSTVSRVLNRRDTGVKVTRRTRERIQDACNRLNYHPNVHARRLFAGRSDTLAVVVPPLSSMPVAPGGYQDPNLAETLADLTVDASRASQDLLLVTADQRFLETRRYVDLFRGRVIDGMLVWGARPTDQEYIQTLVTEAFPIVLLNGHIPAASVPHVVADNRGGAAALARRLLDAGHRRIAYIAGPETARAAVQRHAGVLAALTEAGVELQHNLPGVFSYECGVELGGSLLDQRTPPTAIMAVNDLVAMGIVEAVIQRGLKVPEDVSVTGGDGAFPYYRPALTTFTVPMAEIGQRGLQLLLQLIENPDAWAEWRHAGRQNVPVQIQPGKTVAPPRRSEAFVPNRG